MSTGGTVTNDKVSKQSAPLLYKIFGCSSGEAINFIKSGTALHWYFKHIKIPVPQYYADLLAYQVGALKAPIH